MRVDILYTVNSQYKEIMLTSCVSLILNNMDKDIYFHIVTSDFSCLDYEYCKSVLSKFPSVTCEFYPLDKKYIEKFNIPNWRGSQIANARIFFQDLINLTDVEKLLYLDADTIVVSDIKDAFNHSNPINAVLDSCLQKRVDKMNLTNYFNSGVLLFNVKEWISEKCQDKVIDFLKKNTQIELEFPDQDLLNFALCSYFGKMHPRFNVGPQILMGDINHLYYKDGKRLLGQLDVIESINNGVIHHAYGLGRVKPWTNNKTNPFTLEFDEYMKYVNENFKKEELCGFWQILNENKYLLYMAILAPNYLPLSVNRTLRKVIKKFK